MLRMLARALLSTVLPISVMSAGRLAPAAELAHVIKKGIAALYTHVYAHVLYTQIYYTHVYIHVNTHVHTHVPQCAILCAEQHKMANPS